MPDQRRGIRKVVNHQSVVDGDGVKIRRLAVRGQLETFDPFLLLDEIYTNEPADYIGGFPEHPHRGFETVTYMLAGKMRHRDHMGNEGLLTPGSVQWMTAGRGVIHSEMPEQENGLLRGFQLWINLPAAEKMTDPKYQEYSADQIPVIEMDSGNSVRVIAGELALLGQTAIGPVNSVSVLPDYFDITLNSNTTMDLQVPREKSALLYTYEGTTTITNADGDTKPLHAGQLALLGDGDTLTLSGHGQALLLAGVPLNEPIANAGPFVMNTAEEIQQAIADYRNGRLVD
jgi:redox-sensitive bicupin YhaK (pirin superfamily)